MDKHHRLDQTDVGQASRLNERDVVVKLKEKEHTHCVRGTHIDEKEHKHCVRGAHNEARAKENKKKRCCDAGARDRDTAQRCLDLVVVARLESDVRTVLLSVETAVKA